MRSRDGGASWQQLPGTHDDIHCISLSTARPQTVYVATARGPYRSADEGQHWELINHGLQRPYALHISAALDDADLVLVTVSTNARRQQPQLYRSTTGGAEWQPIISMGSEDDMVVAIDWDPATRSVSTLEPIEARSSAAMIVASRGSLCRYACPLSPWEHWSLGLSDRWIANRSLTSRSRIFPRALP